MTDQTEVVANHPDAQPVENAPFTRQPQVMPLVFFPDSKLLEVSKPVSFDPYERRTAPDGEDLGVWVHNLKEFGDDLIATMQGNNGVGLSAIQVGMPVRVIVVAGRDVNPGNNDAHPIVMVNPQWAIETTGLVSEKMNEGCLSFPAVFEDVERWPVVNATWQDVDGKEQTGTFHGVQAQVIQHECEHLDGHLFIEHLPIHKRDKIRLKMKQRARLTAKIDRLVKRKNGSLQSLISAGLVRGATNRPGFRSGR